MKTVQILTASFAAASLLFAAPMADAAPSSEVTSKVLTVDEYGNPTSGMASFPVGPASGEIGIRKIPGLPGTVNESVGGGDWSYGWRMVNLTTKECFSHYMHRTKSHTATASMAGLHRSSTTRSGNWARAVVRAGVAGGTCNVYWSTR